MKYSNIFAILCVSSFAQLGAMEDRNFEYLIKKEHAEQCEDRQRWISVPRQLFMGLCINAHHDAGRDKKHFYELLAKVKDHIINIDLKDDVDLTQKEFFAGLIMHVKYANNYLESDKGPIFEVFIRDQRTMMTFGPNFYNPNNVSAQNYAAYNAHKLERLHKEFQALLQHPLEETNQK